MASDPVKSTTQILNRVFNESGQALNISGTIGGATTGTGTEDDGMLVTLSDEDRALLGGSTATADANFTVATGAGTILADNLAFSVANNGSADGVFDGATLPAGVTLDFPPVGNGTKYSAVTYDATGTSFLIIETRE